MLLNTNLMFCEPCIVKYGAFGNSLCT